MTDLLTALEKEVKSFIPVTDTPKGRKDIASLAHRVAQSKTFLDGLGKNLTEDAQKKVKSVNAERKIMRDRLDELKATARQPLTDWEAAEKEKAEKIQSDIDSLSIFTGQENYITERFTSGEMQEKLDELKAIKIGSSFGERINEASLIKEQETEKLQLLIFNKIKAEEEQAELELFRKEKEKREEDERLEEVRLEGEERLKQKVIDDARILKETEEKERKQLQQKHEEELLKAEKDKEAAIQAIIDKQEKEKQDKIKLDAELERIRLEGIRLEEVAEEKRQANKAHRTKINNNIVYSLESIGLDKEMSRTIIRQIVAGKIPNVTIKY
jgi:hypothetical protein